jgi:hypothetical protein
MVKVVVFGGDRSSVVDGMAYDLEKNEIFFRFKSTQKWYAKVVNTSLIFEALDVVNGIESFGQWANRKGILKSMEYVTEGI